MGNKSSRLSTEGRSGSHFDKDDEAWALSKASGRFDRLFAAAPEAQSPPRSAPAVKAGESKVNAELSSSNTPASTSSEAVHTSVSGPQELPIVQLSEHTTSATPPSYPSGADRQGKVPSLQRSKGRAEHGKVSAMDSASISPLNVSAAPSGDFGAFGPVSPQQPPIPSPLSDDKSNSRKTRRVPPVEPLNLPPRAPGGTMGPGWVPNRPAPMGYKVPFQSPHTRLTQCVLNRNSEDFKSKYELGRELGRGQFGVTYLCIDKATRRQYACKSIAKRKLNSKEDVQDVRNEIAIMEHLVGHPSIVELKGAYEDRISVHLVMELCEGGELFDRIAAKGHYSEQAASALCHTIISVVQTCHSMSVMHRDLKPENFLFLNTTEESPLKATDFGLSVFFNRGDTFHELVGSPYYVAPEVLYKKYGPEADIWSAGVILYILLCGVPPFWGETEDRIFNEIKHGSLDLVSLPWPRVSESAKQLVRGMLTRDPKKRFTADQVLNHPWIAQAGIASPQPLDVAVINRMRRFAAMNKFKKLALNFIATNLSDEERMGLMQMFRAMDVKNTGHVTLEELRKGLEQRGCHFTPAEQETLLASADLNNDGAINYTEFIAATMHLSKLEKEDRLYAAFQFFDHDQSGFITADEIAKALTDHNIPVDKVMLHSIISEIDKDFDGRINYDEFAAMMRSTDDGFSPLPAAAAHALAPRSLISPGVGRTRFADLPILSPRPMNSGANFPF